MKKVVIYSRGTPQENKRIFGKRRDTYRLTPKTPELGIWIKKSAHGHGYGKEAVVALKEWANENIEYEYILYPVVDENYASRRIPEFLGGKIAREYDKESMSGKKWHFIEYRIYPMQTKK